jgi:hypothetical protein
MSANKKKIKNKNDLLVIPSLDSVYKNTVDLSTYNVPSLKLILKIYSLPL